MTCTEKVRTPLGLVNWKALAIAAAGLILTFTAPTHRIDLLVTGLAGLVGGVVWRPRVAPVLLGAALPFFFFAPQIVGPLGVTPPGLVLIVSWVAVIARRTKLQAEEHTSEL